MALFQDWVYKEEHRHIRFLGYAIFVAVTLTVSLVIVWLAKVLLVGMLMATLSSRELTAWRHLTLLGAMFILGSVAAIFRQVRQLEYGLVEVGFGLAAAWFFTGLSLGANPLANLLAVGSATYVISRGVSNCIDGTKRRFSTPQLIKDIIDA